MNSGYLKFLTNENHPITSLDSYVLSENIGKYLKPYDRVAFRHTCAHTLNTVQLPTKNEIPRFRYGPPIYCLYLNYKYGYTKHIGGFGFQAQYIWSLIEIFLGKLNHMYYDHAPYIFNYKDIDYANCDIDEIPVCSGCLNRLSWDKPISSRTKLDHVIYSLAISCPEHTHGLNFLICNRYSKSTKCPLAKYGDVIKDACQYRTYNAAIITTRTPTGKFDVAKLNK